MLFGFLLFYSTLFPGHPAQVATNHSQGCQKPLQMLIERSYVRQPIQPAFLLIVSPALGIQKQPSSSILFYLLLMNLIVYQCGTPCKTATKGLEQQLIATLYSSISYRNIQRQGHRCRRGIAVLINS